MFYKCPRPVYRPVLKLSIYRSCLPYVYENLRFHDLTSLPAYVCLLESLLNFSLLCLYFRIFFSWFMSLILGWWSIFMILLSMD
jgi:hypothetical protein